MPEQPISTEPLIAVIDALWFKLGQQQKDYTCFVVLLRPVKTQQALVAKVVLLAGKESKSNWRKVLAQLPKRVTKRIVAITADGFSGLVSLAKEKGWHFQWCQVHLKRRIWELRGVRKLPGKEIRQRATKLIYQFLETPHQSEADLCLNELRHLFSLPQCPRSLISRLGCVFKKRHLFRTYLLVPDLNLPISTNSVEQINNQIRGRLSLMRGVRSVKALKRWLGIIHRTIKPIACRGYKETIKFYR